jgi:THAP4-like, heme-binding beta-barrel domain
VVEVEEGTFDGTTIRLATTSVARSASAKVITALERDIFIDGDAMRYILRMAAVGQPMTDHLRAELRRVTP